MQPVQQGEVSKKPKKNVQSLTFVGKINNNDGIIDAGVFGKAVDIMFFRKNEAIERKRIIEVRNVCLHGARYLENSDVEIFDKRWDLAQTLSFVLCCYHDADDEDKFIHDFHKITDDIRSTNITINSFNRSKLERIYNHV